MQCYFTTLVSCSHTAPGGCQCRTIVLNKRRGVPLGYLREFISLKPNAIVMSMLVIGLRRGSPVLDYVPPRTLCGDVARAFQYL